MRRQESFPWIIVMGGAVLYWTIALGIGIPSLYRLLGEPGPARRVTATETRCVQTQTIDGTPVVFGDCITVRFLPDTSEIATVDRVPHRRTPTESVISGPDPEIEPSDDELRIDPSDTAGRTSF
jgi:hypothetical protein